MPMKSMTAFARIDGTLRNVRWHWEVRTVNGRGLDIRMRLPAGYDGLERQARQICGNKITRGNCTVNLNYKREKGCAEIRLNEAALKQICTAINRARKLVEAPPPSLEGLLGLKDVLETVELEESEEEKEERHHIMLADLTRAIDGIIEMREREGAHLTMAILTQIQQMEDLLHQIETLPARTPQALKKKLAEQVRNLLSEDTPLNSDRLYQEAAILATKADIAEELERLKAHISQARDLLKETLPVGRKFEFLTQEFNREANTICSKSNDQDLSRIGLELKTIIDQLREQVQNIE